MSDFTEFDKVELVITNLRKLVKEKGMTIIEALELVYYSAANAENKTVKKFGKSTDYKEH